jgi:hypothetical protein
MSHEHHEIEHGDQWCPKGSATISNSTDFKQQQQKRGYGCAQQLLFLSHNLTFFAFTDLYSAHMQASCRDSSASLRCRHFPQ